MSHRAGGDGTGYSSNARFYFYRDLVDFFEQMFIHLLYALMTISRDFKRVCVCVCVSSSTFLRVDYLYKLLGMLLHGRFVSSSGKNFKQRNCTVRFGFRRENLTAI